MCSEVLDMCLLKKIIRGLFFPKLRPVDLERKRFEDEALARKKAAYEKALAEARASPSTCREQTNDDGILQVRTLTMNPDPFDHRRFQ